MRILKYCLKTKHPIIDPSSLLAKDELLGQNEISRNILHTCRLYKTEGYRIWSQHNHFVCTQVEDEPSMFHRPEVNLEHLPFIKHLGFRHLISRPNVQVLKSAMFLLQGIEKQMPALEKLELDFVDKLAPIISPFAALVQTRADGRETVPEALMEDARAFHRRSKCSFTAPRRQLQQLTVTGLEINDSALLAIKLLATIVRAGGKFKVGLGSAGRRFCQERQSCQLVRAAPLRLRSVLPMNVDRWIIPYLDHKPDVVGHDYMWAYFIPDEDESPGEN